MTTAKKSTGPKSKIVSRMQRVKGSPRKLAGEGKSQLTQFLDFVREQGVVGLAIGLAIGTAAGAAVKQIVDGLINPIIGFMIGGIDLTQLKWVVVGHGSNGKGGLVFSWGSILSSIITLLATALVIYWLIHMAKLDKLDKPKE